MAGHTHYATSVCSSWVSRKLGCLTSLGNTGLPHPRHGRWCSSICYVMLCCLLCMNTAVDEFADIFCANGKLYGVEDDVGAVTEGVLCHA